MGLYICGTVWFFLLWVQLGGVKQCFALQENLSIEILACVSYMISHRPLTLMARVLTPRLMIWDAQTSDLGCASSDHPIMMFSTPLLFIVAPTGCLLWPYVRQGVPGVLVASPERGEYCCNLTLMLFTFLKPLTLATTEPVSN